MKRQQETIILRSWRGVSAKIGFLQCFQNLIMTIKTVICAMFCIAAIGNAGAVMYKSVGPDGKVTFSDQPPVGATGQLSVMGSAGFKPVEASRAPVASAAANVADVMAQSKAEAKAAAAAKPKYAPTSSSAEWERGPSKQVAEALNKAMGFTALARETRDLCQSTRPTALARFQGSFDQWEKRHTAVLADVERVLSALPAPKRSELEGAVNGRIGTMLAVVVKAPLGARINWCDKSFSELDGGSIDFANRADIAGPLRDFGRK